MFPTFQWESSDSLGNVEISYRVVMSTLKEIVLERLAQLDVGPVEAATAAGIERTFIRDIVEGKKRSVRNDKMPDLARALKLDAAALSAGKLLAADEPAEPPKRRVTTVVGRAGAATDGKLVYAEGQGGLGTVLLPEGATEDSVAIEIEGYSMGVLADGALVFYTETHAAPTDDMLGLVVIIGTDKGDVLLKKLLRGSRLGLFDLESINGPTIRDQKVIWAAHIDSLVPPWRAKRLRVEASDVSL